MENQSLGFELAFEGVFDVRIGSTLSNKLEQGTTGTSLYLISNHGP